MSEGLYTSHSIPSFLSSVRSCLSPALFKKITVLTLHPSTARKSKVRYRTSVDWTPAVRGHSSGYLYQIWIPARSPPRIRTDERTFLRRWARRSVYDRQGQRPNSAGGRIAYWLGSHEVAKSPSPSLFMSRLTPPLTRIDFEGKLRALVSQSSSGGECCCLSPRESMCTLHLEGTFELLAKAPALGIEPLIRPKQALYAW